MRPTRTISCGPHLLGGRDVGLVARDIWRNILLNVRSRRQKAEPRVHIGY